MNVKSHFYKCLFCKILQITLLCIITRSCMPCFADEVFTKPDAKDYTTLAVVEGPTWTIGVNYAVGNFDNDAVNPGNETLFTYTVYNTSINDPKYNMIEVALPGGLDGKVINAFDKTKTWAVTYNKSDVTFSGDEGEYIAPDRNNTFYVYTSNIFDAANPPSLADANALAEGTISGTEAFPTIQTYTTKKEFVLKTRSIAGYAFTSTNRMFNIEVECVAFQPDYTNKVLKVASSTNLSTGAWTTNSLLHSITGAVTTVNITNVADRAFFKIIAE